MTTKLVSTLLLTGHREQCKCEIYQFNTDNGLGFSASVYLRRKVIMMLKEAAVSMRHSHAPDSRPQMTWVEARNINDIKGTSLEEVEAEMVYRYENESFFIPAFFDSSNSF